MQPNNKYYQFSIINKILYMGTVVEVPVNHYYSMAIEEKLNAALFREVLRAAGAQALEALGKPENAVLLSSLIVHSMYLGVMSEAEMFPNPNAAKADIQPTDQVDPAIHQ